MSGMNSSENVVQGFRLSPQQERAWLLERDTRPTRSSAQCRVILEGSLDSTTLKTALQDILQRHEILRTTFQIIPGMTLPVQVIAESGVLSYAEYDLTGQTSREQEHQVDVFSQALKDEGTDSTDSSLMRTILVKLSDVNHVLLIDLPGYCADAVTFSNLLRELESLYTGYVQGDTVALNDPLQYADFAEWQHALLEDEDGQSGRAYWREQATAIFGALGNRLSIERGKSAIGGIALKRIPVAVSKQSFNEIDAMVKRQGSSHSTFFLACWCILLQRLMGQEEVVVGVACDGRTHDETRNAFGPFAKYLPVRRRLDDNLRFNAVLVSIQHAVTESHEWQEYFSWEAIREPIENTAGMYFPFCFEFDEQVTFSSRSDLSCVIERRETYLDRFKIRFVCHRRGDGIDAALQYDELYYSNEAMACLVEQLATLVSQAACQPEALIADLETLSENERHKVLQSFNASPSYKRRDQCLHHLVEEQVAQTPDNVAVASEDQSLTYRDLDRRANRLAHYLKSHGVGLETAVGICMERSTELIVGLLGILKAGGAYVPIDPSYPKDRKKYLLEDSQAPILLTQERIREEFLGTACTVLSIDSEEHCFDEYSELKPSTSETPDGVAYIIYTSGSTGRPKGVLVTHRNAVHSTQARLDYYAESVPCFLLLSSFAFDSSVAGIFWTLSQGGRLCLAREGVQKSPSELGVLIAHAKVTHVLSLPSLYFVLLEQVAAEQLGSLHTIIVAGESCPKELVLRHQARLPLARLFNEYGPTEGTVWSTVYRTCIQDEGVTVSIGRPIAGVRIYLLDTLMRPVSIGMLGELYIAGQGLARAYHNRPDMTAEKFIPDPFCVEAGGRLYRTGDLARYRTDGNIEFAGRRDQQVKIRGYRIELGEIEARILEHPKVQDAVVLAREGTLGDMLVVAYVVQREGGQGTTALREFLKERLPEYMMPSATVLLPRFPLTPNGKIDRNVLPMPDVVGQLAHQYVAPRTPTEELLAGIWAEVLQVARVGGHDNFFDLGGHSLLATQAMARLRDVFRIDLPMRVLFESATVSELALAVDAARGSDPGEQAPPLVAIPRTGPLPLSFAQQRLWVLAQLDPDSTAYHIPIALRVRGELDLAALEQSVHELVRRHEALRTKFQRLNGVPMQVIGQAQPVSIPVIDLQHLPDERREQAAIRLASVEAERPFDLRYGPLMRVSLIRLQPTEQLLLLSLHHIVSDAWSSHLLVKELTEFYASTVEGRQARLPDMSLQYADVSQWQRAWLSGPVLERELAYWKNVLGGELPVLDLPTDRPRPAVQTSRGAMITSTIQPELASGLKTLSRRTGATLYMTLLSAFFMLLARETEQSDLIVGTPIANRTRKETEGLIGFFVNTLAIRAKLLPEASLSDVMATVREACLEAYAHQDMPFEKLVDVLQPTRDVSRSPIFQVMFDLQNAPVAELQVTGLEFEPVEIESTTAKFDLSMTVQEADGRLIVGLEYNADLFLPATITRLLARYELILISLNRNLSTTVGSIPLLDQAERQALLAVNRAGTSADSTLSLTLLIERQVERTPMATAVVLEDQSLTYAALNHKANRVAQWLRSRGVGPERRVGICLDRSLDLVVALLAILKAGGAYVPIDPAYPIARQRQVAIDAGLDLLLVEGDVLPSDDDFPMPVHLMSGLEDELRSFTGGTVSGTVSPEQAAYVIFTSGSTGTPKGVVVSHGSLARHVATIAEAYRLGQTDRVLQFASISFDVAAEEIWSALLVGAAVILQPCRLFDSLPAFSRFLDRQRVSIAGIPASYWHEWIRSLDTGGGVPPSLRLLIVGNEPVSASDLNQWYRRAGTQVRWLNAYGPTETTITASLHEPSPLVTEEGPQIVPIGRPLPGRSLYVLDRNLEPVPFGAPGHLFIGGESLARGYLDDPKRTGAVFVPDPFSDRPGARLYATGDRVLVRRDGTLEFLGRFDDQIKLRGFRIEPGEIEGGLRRHPDVRAALVRARTDAQGRVNLVAYVVPGEAGVFTASALRQWLGEILPEHMVPSVIVPLPDLPRTPAGKIDLKALPSQDWASSDRKTSADPITPLQRRLAAMWSEVLGVGRIGLHDNFFDIGGHSLLAVQLIARIQTVVDRPLGLMDLFQCPTIEQLAHRLEGLQATSSEVVLLREGRDLPPLFCFDPDGTHVQAYGPLAQSLEDGRPVYGLSLSHLFTLRWQEVSLPKLAERQAALIRERQPRGPYHLIGWSNGGILALATAHMLERAGESVAFLGMLDTQPDHALYATGGPAPVEELMAYIRRERRDAFDAIAESEREDLKHRLEQLDEETRLEAAIQWARDREFLSPEEAEASIGSLKLGYALAREAARFLASTKSHPIQAPVHVWWTTATMARRGEEPVNWTEHTTGPVSIETLTGDHMDAVYSIHAHQRIGEALAATKVERS
ncbi:MAG: amino acid adenylation domain-containing protein [Nitrospira sp.]|nr:amino acid adenylation domain-containing protein [Nitrospira sp.]